MLRELSVDETWNAVQNRHSRSISPPIVLDLECKTEFPGSVTRCRC